MVERFVPNRGDDNHSICVTDLPSLGKFIRVTFLPFHFVFYCIFVLGEEYCHSPKRFSNHGSIPLQSLSKSLDVKYLRRLYFYLKK